jgi:hypothetical protein
MMRKLMLGAVLSAAFGLPASAAGVVAGMQTASLDHVFKRSACHLVASNRPLRLLRDREVQVAKRPVAVPIERTVVREPAPRISRAVATRSEPVRVPRFESARFERTSSERVSLMVGIGY